MDIDFQNDQDSLRQIHRRMAQLPGWRTEVHDEDSWYAPALTCMALLAPAGDEPSAIVTDKDRAALFVVYDDRVLTCRAPKSEAGHAAVQMHPRSALRSVSLSEGATPFANELGAPWPDPLTVTLNYAGESDFTLKLDRHGVDQFKPVWDDLLKDALA